MLVPKVTLLVDCAPGRSLAHQQMCCVLAGPGVRRVQRPCWARAPPHSLLVRGWAAWGGPPAAAHCAVLVTQYKNSQRRSSSKASLEWSAAGSFPHSPCTRLGTLGGPHLQQHTDSKLALIMLQDQVLAADAFLCSHCHLSAERASQKRLHLQQRDSVLCAELADLHQVAIAKLWQPGKVWPAVLPAADCRRHTAHRAHGAQYSSRLVPHCLALSRLQ